MLSMRLSVQQLIKDFNNTSKWRLYLFEDFPFKLFYYIINV